MKQNKAKHSKQNIPKKVSKKNAKKTKKETTPKKSIVKFIIFIFVIAIITGICLLAIKLYTFQKLAKEMFNNSPSTIFDVNNNEIAQIGIERNRENIDFENIPKQLIDAYVSIEDERFYKHHGVDIKRTGAAVLSYVIRRRFFIFWW